LQLPHWSREEHSLFPAEFRAVVRQLVRGHYSASSIPNTLPMDVLELVIAHLARYPYSFATVPAASRSAQQHDDTDPDDTEDSESDETEDDSSGDSEEDYPVVPAAKRLAAATSSQ
jgi:hypothetical protein